MEQLQILLKYMGGYKGLGVVSRAQFYHLSSEGSWLSPLIPRRKGKGHEDTVDPLPTTLRITLSFTVLWPYLRMRTISGKLVWDL